MSQSVNRALQRLSLVVLITANLVPLAGVPLWNWGVAGVLLFYWLEMGSVIVWSSVKALFAEVPQEYGEYVPLHGLPYKRGSISVRGDTVVYPRNLVTVFAGGALAVIWAVYGFITFGMAGGSSPTWTLNDPLVVTTVLLGAVVTFVGHGLSVWLDYLGERQYEDITPGVLLRQPLGYYVGMGAVFAVGPNILSADMLYPVTTALVTVHVALAVVAHYRAHNDRPRRLSELLFGDAAASWDAVEVPDEEPQFETETSARTNLVAGVVRGLSYPRLLVAYVLFGLLSVGLLSGSGVGATVGLLSFTLGPLLAVSVSVTILDYWIGYRHMEYRLYDRAIVGYDTWLDQPQWAVEYTDIDDVVELRGVVGRVCGTSTVLLRFDDDHRTIRLTRPRNADQLHADIDQHIW